MIWFALLALVVVLFAALGLILLKQRQPGASSAERWPYYVKKPLSEPEQVLYHRLIETMPECIVLAQVQLSRVLGVKKGVNRAMWHNRVAQKSVDFVVCLKDSTIVAVVELDDSTHRRNARVTADKNKDKALADAGVTVIRWNVSSLPDENAIRSALAA